MTTWLVSRCERSTLNPRLRGDDDWGEPPTDRRCARVTSPFQGEGEGRPGAAFIGAWAQRKKERLCGGYSGAKEAVRH